MNPMSLDSGSISLATALWCTQEGKWTICCLLLLWITNWILKSHKDAPHLPPHCPQALRSALPLEGLREAFHHHYTHSGVHFVAIWAIVVLFARILHIDISLMVHPKWDVGAITVCYTSLVLLVYNLNVRLPVQPLFSQKPLTCFLTHSH